MKASTAFNARFGVWSSLETMSIGSSGRMAEAFDRPDESDFGCPTLVAFLAKRWVPHSLSRTPLRRPPGAGPPDLMWRGRPRPRMPTPSETKRETHHEPRGDSRPRLSSGAKLRCVTSANRVRIPSSAPDDECHHPPFKNQSWSSLSFSLCPRTSDGKRGPAPHEALRARWAVREWSFLASRFEPLTSD